MSAAGAPRAIAVVDLGFGDAGKGLITDYLVRRLGARCVVRFNGGPQAAHNVVLDDGRHHTFAQLGAASFVNGVRTFLSRHIWIDPPALLLEAAAIARQGVHDALARVEISEAARVITPFHQAANRLRELARGAARHGSCGVGVGEAMAHHLAHPDSTVRAADLRGPDVLRRKLVDVRAEVRATLEPAAPSSAHSNTARAEWSVFDRDELIDAWIDRARLLARHLVPDASLGDIVHAGSVVFEGAQGVLLDETVGFHPYTTWSTCTPANARTLLAEAAPDRALEVWGVLRAHAIRHGPGPLPTEDPALGTFVVEHNRSNAWQGEVRYGAFDAVLARYALAHAGPLDALVVTHVDSLARRRTWPLANAYDLDGVRVDRLPATPSPTLDEQAELAARLMRARPELRHVDGDEATYLAALEAAIGRSIDVTARGPRASDVTE